MLEDRCLLAADFLAFGAELSLVGVGQQDDGDTVLVGNRVNVTSGLNEGVVITVDADDNSVTEAIVGSFGHDTFLTGVSPNGVFVSGLSNEFITSNFEGFRAEVASPQILVGVGTLGVRDDSRALDVSNSGEVVGTADGGSSPFSWTLNDGLQELSNPVGGLALGLSSLGSAVGFLTPSTTQTRAVLWESGNESFLETPDGFDSSAVDISPNGENIGGRVSFFDLALFETIDQAVVWVDGTLTRLEHANGNVFEGEVLAVSDNGYAVGESEDGSGFIWHESFVGVRMFDEWLLTEFDVTLPTAVTSVNDVLFDGENLMFAASGNAYLVTVPLFDNGPLPYQNKELPSDVNGDGSVSPIDALLPINSINQTVTTRAEIIPFDADLDLVGVGQKDDGDTVLVGNRVNTTSGLNEGVVITVDAADNSVSEAIVGSFGHDTFLTGVSPNGMFVSGLSNESTTSNFEGFRVEVASPQILVGVGTLGVRDDSRAFDVSSSGVVVGDADGSSTPFSWTVRNGLQTLSNPIGGGAFGVSSSGAAVGLLTPSTTETRAVLWENGNEIFLDTPESFDSSAIDISPNGVYIGGEVSFFDLTTFVIVDQAAVWENGTLNRLEDANGNVFEGEVLAVSDNGYAVGESEEGSGFIWHESFVGVRMFDEWLLTEFDVTLPTAVTSVNDVLFDGENLMFAASGNSYLITTSIPR